MWNSLPQEIVHATSPVSFSAGVSAWRNGSSPYPTLAHNCHGKTKNITAKTKTSRQNQKPLDKTENLTAKPKTSRQKQSTSRQNQKPYGKTKYLTAKTKYFTVKPNTHGKTKAICFCCELFGFAVRFLVLPWVILFLPWGFWFCCDVFVFAVRFLVLPWQLWATISVCLT